MKLKGRKKSNAKAVGLKSTFVDNNSTIMTIFGKGNEAIISKKINNNIVEDIQASKFSVEPKEKYYNILQSNFPISNVNTPKEKDGTLYYPTNLPLDTKLKYEALFFKDGENGFNDNIHIQIAHNIFDIYKIVAPYVNNIIFTLHNIIREPDDDYDYVGTLYTYNSYADFISKSNNNNVNKKGETSKEKNINDKYFSKICNCIRSDLGIEKNISKAALQYYPQVFYNNISNRKPSITAVETLEKNIFNTLRLVSAVRQYTFHGKYIESGCLFNLDNDKKFEDEKISSTALSELKKLIDDRYNQAITKVNDDFINTNSDRVFSILFTLFPNEKREDLVQYLYDFTVTKVSLNRGFSVKKIRESILNQKEREIYYNIFRNYKNDDTIREFSSIRRVFNKFTDIICDKYLLDNSDLAKELIESLRITNKEECKVNIYNKIANDIYKAEYSKFNILFQKIRNIKNKNEIKDITIKNPISAENTTQFSKIMYILCLFLDGKEINELLSTLINKFDNISSLVTVYNRLHTKINFKPTWEIFNADSAKKVVNELMTIKSFARMQTKVSQEIAFRKSIKDALAVIGVPQEDLDTMSKEICDHNNNDKSERNFLSNNVIKSTRFHYLMRYANPLELQNIAKNKELIAFELNSIANSDSGEKKIIDRYYKAYICISKNENPDIDISNNVPTSVKIKNLTEYISNIDTGIFRNVVMNTQNKNDEEANEKDKEVRKSMLSLYLLLLYRVFKNLVNINSRYTIALFSYERDMYLLCNIPNIFKSKKNETYLKLAKTLKNKKWKKIFEGDYSNSFKNFDATIFDTYRNKIMHLNSLQYVNSYIDNMGKIDSYFSIFHYVLQNIVISKAKNDNLSTFEENLSKYNNYCKDFLKLLNLPFAYNLPRYKNLSIEQLFDKNIKPQTIDTSDNTAE